MTTYTYSVTTDFGGTTPKTEQLHTEISNDGGIAPTLQGINMTGDDVDIVFDTALSAGEQTTLNGLVSAHAPAPVVGSNVFTININSNQVTSAAFIPIATFEFPGSAVLKNITNIKIISHKTNGGTSYDVRVYDNSCFNEIASANFTNTTDSSNDLGTISNIPTQSAIFEVQVRVTGTTTAVVKSLNILYS